MFLAEEKTSETFIYCFSFDGNKIKYFNTIEWKEIILSDFDTFYFNNKLKKWVWKWKKKSVDMRCLLMK